MATQQQFNLLQSLRPPISKQTLPAEPKPVHLKDGSKNEFIALAVAIIDNARAHPEQNYKLLERLLQAYSQIFQKNLPERVKNPMDCFNKLASLSPLTTLITELAYTLRIIALNEIFDNPKHYVLAFNEQREFRSIDELLDADVSLGEAGITAVASALSLKIDIAQVEIDKPLSALITVGELTSKNHLKIQVNDNSFHPYLIKAPELTALRLSKEPLLNGDVLKTRWQKARSIVKQHNQDLLADYQANLKILEASDLVNKALLKLHMQINGHCYVGAINQPEILLDSVLRFNKQSMLVNTREIPTEKTKKIKALAWKMCMNVVEPSLVFQKVDDPDEENNPRARI